MPQDGLADARSPFPDEATEKTKEQQLERRRLLNREAQRRLRERQQREQRRRLEQRQTLSSTWNIEGSYGSPRPVSHRSPNDAVGSCEPVPSSFAVYAPDYPGGHVPALPIEQSASDSVIPHAQWEMPMDIPLPLYLDPFLYPGSGNNASIWMSTTTSPTQTPPGARSISSPPLCATRPSHPCPITPESAAGSESIAAARHPSSTAEHLSSHEHEDLNNALFLAAKNGHVGVMRALAEMGSDLDARDAEGNSALHLALLGRHKDVVLFLLERSVDTAVVNSDGLKPL
ncbi:MAG: Ankyrin repeat and death domain-containing protein 1A [Bathelium mastoideum]|nr:MAG: Ankyrin repeat and death domain-containing protein 1A [Bathelium mastoideum]